MHEAEQIWRTKPDEELLNAGAHLNEFTDEGERVIRAELEARGLSQPPPSARPAKAAAAKRRAKKAAPDTVFAHWCTLIENLQESPLRFYQSVELALSRRQIPGTENSRVEYLESGVLSAKREYLHVTRGGLVFDICGAPFGTGFFVSSWLAETQLSIPALLKIWILIALFGLPAAAIAKFGVFLGLLLTVVAIPLLLWLAKAILADSAVSPDILADVPIIGWLYTWLFKPSTYYRIDTTLMFQQAVHSAVMEVVDEITKANGLRALSESERKPIMREFRGRTALG